MHTGFSDDGTTVTMADQNCGPILKVENPLRCGHIVGKRRFGLLHNGDMEALLCEDLIDGLR
jgi:hypothetical protein